MEWYGLNEDMLQDAEHYTPFPKETWKVALQRVRRATKYTPEHRANIVYPRDSRGRTQRDQLPVQLVVVVQPVVVAQPGPHLSLLFSPDYYEYGYYTVYKLSTCIQSNSIHTRNV